MPQNKYISQIILAALFVAVILSACSPKIPSFAGSAYYVNCDGGSDSASGLSPSQAWGSLVKLNNTIFQQGDAIFIQRGTRCEGPLNPQGSGAEGEPILLAAYGRGNRPIIDGGKADEAFKLFDQEYWHIQDLEFIGGVDYGILVSGSPSSGTLRHFRLTNLVVHDVYGDPPEHKVFGLVIFHPGQGETNRFEDVILDGITAYNTNQWAGISILGSNPLTLDTDPPGFGSNITIRNSTVYNTWGDGITLFYVQNGLIEYSVAYDTGQQPPPQTIGTPSSIWTWSCYQCTVQFNESYQAKTPEVDGGAFDIDWNTRDNLYQYNYGHDNVGYCISVFGAERLTTENSVIRYNVCANNGRSSPLASRQGDVFISTWNGGKIDGIQIYNNTFYWNPASNSPLIVNHADFTGERSVFFKNNIVYSTVTWFTDTESSLTLDHNLYWYAGESSKNLIWIYGDDVYTSSKDYLENSGQDNHSLFADPLLNQAGYHEIGFPGKAFRLQKGSPAIDAGETLEVMGARDFFGGELQAGSGIDIGAHEYGAERLDSLSTERVVPLVDNANQLLLLAFMDPTHAVSRSQMVILRSQWEQFSSQGLRMVIMVPDAVMSLEEIENWWLDWKMDSVPLWIIDQETAWDYGIHSSAAIYLLDASGKLVQHWQGLTLAYELAQVNAGFRAGAKP